MSVCAASGGYYRPSPTGRTSPTIRRSIPLFRPLCTTEKPPQLSWFSSALQSLNDTHHHSKERLTTTVTSSAPPLPPRGGTDHQQWQRKSLTTKWLDTTKHDSSSEDEKMSESGSDDQQQSSPSSYNFVKPYGNGETNDEQTRRSLETMSVVTEEPEPEEEKDTGVRLLSRKTLEDDNGHTVHRSDFLKGSYPYDSSESEEDEHPNAHLAAYGIHRLGIYTPPNASDGNPVRHSLLNLVAEEDIPELLQAMAEECHFVFDDCDRSNMPTTSGIIHTPAKRMERRKQRNVDRICFEEKPPQVFAYVDESTAYEEGEWSEGFPISYDEYKSIVEAAQQETAQQHLDLANWRMLMEQKFSLQDAQIRAMEGNTNEERENNNDENDTILPSSKRNEDLGVTSTFSYTTPSSTSSCAQPLNLRQPSSSDRETSAI